MIFGNNDGPNNNYGQDDNENLGANRLDDDLDYLYGERQERPIYASRSSLSAEPLPLHSSYRSHDVDADLGNLLLDKECQLETQSGFMLVFKGAKDKATLSVRRKVGTPPSSAVTLTPDELRRLSNLVGELSPEPASRQRLAVGSERPPAESDFDSFVAREYPELAQRRRVKKAFPVSVPEALFELVTQKKLMLMAGLALAVLITTAVSTVVFLTSKPFAGAPIAATPSPAKVGLSGSLSLEETARTFVLDMLNFRKDSYRQAQIKAMAMMTSDLADRYWKETNFPLTRSQLRALPQDQEVRIESVVPTTISPGNYQVDVKGNLIGASGTTPTAVVIRLSIIQDASGKLLVSEQKDITAQANAAVPTPTDVNATATTSASSEQHR
ncbi:MAG: hypothetical protein Q8T09_06185 [Candidatus Melainabacteria bacterium]|nr:hypothetical protein [Candidatus Melainabacteria bacterium]